MDRLIKKNLNKRLHFTTNIDLSVQKADVVFITVGTPIRSNGDIDIGYVESAAYKIANNLNGYKIIVLKSTVPVGTAKHIYRIIQSKSRVTEFDLVSNPEFLREGSAVHDCLYMDRLVIGASNKIASRRLEQLYQSFYFKEVIHTNFETAEMIKYASNTFLATKISFINGIARICDQVGADVEMVAKGMGLDDRIGKKFLKAGIGFGGSCLPKDTKALIRIAETNGYDFSLLKAVIKTNLEQYKYIIEKLLLATREIEVKTIGILGLTFKPNTNDLRNAPSIPIIKKLLKLGFVIKAYDPVSIKEVKRKFSHESNISFFCDIYKTIDKCDVCMILTEWDEIRRIDLKRMLQLLNYPIIVDGRNIFDINKMESFGFSYYPIGRGQPTLGM